MKGRPHLAIYPEPIIRNGSDVETLCQEPLKSVIIVGFSDTLIMGKNWRQTFTSLNTCPQCLRAAETLSIERPQDVGYVYAIVPRDSRLGNKLEAQLEESA